MKLKFTIHYNTSWGQAMHVALTTISKDGRKRDYNLLMNTQDGDLWTTETAVLESCQHPVISIIYYYLVEDGNGMTIRKEWERVPRLYAIDSSKNYIFPDQWLDIPLHSYLYSDAYISTQRMRRNEVMELTPVSLYRRTVIFRVSAPQLQLGESLGICGNHPALGNWNPTQYMPMKYMGDREWILSMNVYGVALPLEYKFVVVDDEAKRLKVWEDGYNRTTGNVKLDEGQVLVLYGDSLHVCEKVWKCAGVVVPVFSLRSEHSYGVGDFGDIIRLVDWAVKTGMKAIQILPVNDTSSTHSWTDSHPYNCISVFALHPHYIDLEQLGEIDDEQKRTAYNRQRRELNTFACSDYMAVDRVKSEYIDTAFSQEGSAVLASPEYLSFYDDNRDWLIPYAAFCVLRDRYNTSRFMDWQEHSTYNRQEIEMFCEAEEQVRCIYYVQYNLYRQLRRAAEYARSKGVVLKGDLPIGVYQDSVETWMYPEYFNLDMQMGAPPDNDLPQGQNWGFPTYNWLTIENDGYSWWHRRFGYMSKFFDAFRLDHIVGYFRAWEIPVSSLFGTMGYYSPSLPLTEEEIVNSGLPFRKELLTQPFINDIVVDTIFGVHATYVRDNYLVRKAYGLYSLNVDFDTQEKVRQRFEGHTDENSLWIRDGLYRVISNVLFLEDPYRKGMYHPRFAANIMPVYDILSADEKVSFTQLYNNYFYERHNGYWTYLAMMRLTAMIGNTRMLICAEDLGMLPHCVKSVLDAQRILSLEIQSMPKVRDYEFTYLDDNPYRSVCTISTHDMPPLRMWWEEKPGRTQSYYFKMLQKEGSAPRSLPALLAEEIIGRHLYCPSMMCMLSIQDWLSMDTALSNGNVYEERINTPNDKYNQWKYRMNVTIEQLMSAEQYDKKLNMMIIKSRR